MKNFLIRTGLAGAALLLAPLAVQAADLPAYKAPAYSAPAAYANWSGFYVGLNGGYGFGKSDWDFPAVSLSPKGGLFGGTVGYNFQTGIWVWGAEGDIDYSTMKGSAACGAGTCETKNAWLGTARARLGYGGWNNWLPYITGGLGVGDVKATNSLTGDANKTMLGWTAGAGVEYALFSSWSVKLEYLYVDLGKFDCGSACGAASDDVSFKTNIVRAGLNYRF
ncbi:MAG TPA: outer membrane protein [Pseudolabrys sp.]|nr:outer membrane protein [Pseudolabrys sp.]